MVQQARNAELHLRLQACIGGVENLGPAPRAVHRVSRCGRGRTHGGTVFLVQLVGKLMDNHVAAIVCRRSTTPAPC